MSDLLYEINSYHLFYSCGKDS